MVEGNPQKPRDVMVESNPGKLKVCLLVIQRKYRMWLWVFQRKPKMMVNHDTWGVKLCLCL